MRFYDLLWGVVISDDNQKTLCAHIEEELQVKNPKAYIALIQPATHYCEGCGRSAAKAENLCKPQKLLIPITIRLNFRLILRLRRFRQQGDRLE